MKLDIKRNAIGNISWGIVEKVGMILFQFIIRAAIIRVIGAQYLGLNGLFTAILEMLNFAERGLSTCMVFSMYKPLANEDTGMVCALMSFYRKTYRIMGTVLLLIGLGIMPFLPKLINGSYPSDINIYLLYTIYLANMAAHFFLFAYKTCLLSAHQREDIISRIRVFVNLGLWTVQIFMLMVSKNYYLYIIWQPIFTILINFVNAFCVKKMYPQYECADNTELFDVKAIKKQITGLMIQCLAAASRNSLDSIFLSVYINLVTVAAYGNYYYVMSGLHSCLLITCNALQAGIGNRVALNDSKKNHKDMLFVQFLYLWLSGWCGICMLCFYQWFIRIWVGEEMLFPVKTMLLFGIYMFLLCIGDVYSLYLRSIGKWWEMKFYFISEVIINVILNWLLVVRLGIDGIILATIISRACFIVVTVNRLHKMYFMGISAWHYWKELLYITLVSVLGFVIAYSICEYWQLGILLKGLVCLMIPNGLYLIAGIPLGYSRKIWKLLRRG